MKANIGPQGAHTATAHKIAVIFYALVNNQVAYDRRIWEKRDERRRKRHTAPLKRQAQRLGYKLQFKRKPPHNDPNFIRRLGGSFSKEAAAGWEPAPPRFDTLM